MAAVRQVIKDSRSIENEIAPELALGAVSSQQTLQNLTENADALGIGYKAAVNTCCQIKAKLVAMRTNDLVRLAMTLGAAWHRPIGRGCGSL